MTVSYPPGAKSGAHHHAKSAFIMAYVISGAIRSQVEGEPVRVYHPGETWSEAPARTTRSVKMPAPLNPLNCWRSSCSIPETGHSPRTTTREDEAARQRRKMFAPFDIHDLTPFRFPGEVHAHPDPTRIVRMALRFSLAAAFLSAVADRFGWWKPFGQGSWGAWPASPTTPTSLSRLLPDGY